MRFFAPRGGAVPCTGSAPQHCFKAKIIFLGAWDVGPEDFFVEGSRIEAAFRKYFHRADPEQVSSNYFGIFFLDPNFQSCFDKELRIRFI